MRKWVAIIFSLVFLWGVVLRIYALDQQSFWIDESYSIAIAQAIANHGYPLLDSGTILWRGPAYHYLLSAMILLFGDGPIATRALSVVLGCAAVVLIAVIAWRWFSPRTGIVTFVLMNFSYWEIAWSRQARMYMLLQLLFWLAIYLFDRWRKQKIHWLWPLLCTVAAIGTHQFGWLLVFAFALWWVVQRGGRLMIFSYVGIIIFAIMLVAVTSVTFTHVGPVQYWWHYLWFLITHHTVILFGAIIGLLLALYRNYYNYSLWLTGIFLGCLGVLSYSVPLLQYRYLFFLLPALIMLTAYGISTLHRSWVVSIGITSLIVISGVGFTVVPANHYWLESDAPASPLSYKSFTPQPDFVDAYAFIEEINPDIVITPYPTISRLYRDRDDTAALYVDLTGTIAQPPDREVYTGVHYLNLQELKNLAQTGKTGAVVVDYFAQRRMSSELYSYIESNLKTVYSETTGPWSSITIYTL